MGNFEEDKIWKANGEARRQEKLKVNYPKFLNGGNGNDSGAAISNGFGNHGDQITLPEQQDTNEEGKALWNVEMGGGDVIMEDIEEVVGG